MSIKLFALQLFGKLKPVEKIESARSLLYSHYQEFLNVERSDELKEFTELENFVRSEEFKRRKKEIEELVFKDSVEYNQLKEFDKLKKAKHIQNYLSVSSSGDLKRFETLKNSEKLKEYYELDDYIKEGHFKYEKKEILSQVFKGSVEEQNLKDFRKLKKDRGIKAWLALNNSKEISGHKEFSGSEKLRKYIDLKNLPEKDKEGRKEFRKLKKDQQIKDYFRFEHSKKLKLYRETCDSHLLEKYFDLKKYTESEEFINRKKFLEDKNKFEKSETFRKFKRYETLCRDNDVRFFLKYEKSKAYKNYLDTKDRFDLKRYFELKDLTASKEFLDRKAYLEDRRKWEKTDEFAKEQKYLTMKKLPHLIRYFGYLGTNDFDFFKTWEISFEDQFADENVDKSRWITNSFWASKLLGGNYSLQGDLQCFTAGGNIKTGSRGLSLAVRKENRSGIAWNQNAGFVPTDFEYTSDILSTGESFWQREGIFEAKIRFSPVKQIASTFSLIGENNRTLIHLFEEGARNRIGIVRAGKDGKPEFEGVSLNNLKKGKYYLFRIHWENNQLNWTINEKEIFSAPADQFKNPVHLNLASVVVYDIPGSQLPVYFDIEWIRCYKRK